jgi:hypothetical protein
MLVDPLPVKSLSLVSHTAVTIMETLSFALLDLAPGRTVRKCAAGSSLAGLKGCPLTLTISHTASKENGVIPTNRALIRLDISGLRTDPAVAGSTKAYAYLVIGTPEGVYDTDSNSYDSSSLLETLLGVFAVSPTASTLSEVNLGRIIAGEP